MPIIPAHSMAGTRFWKGPFAAELSPSIWARTACRYSNELEIGLLITRPDQDGEGGEELVCDGYERQRLDLAPFNETRLIVPHRVIFRLESRPVIAGLVVYGRYGQVELYGGLRGTSPDVEAPDCIELPAGSITARRFKH